MAFSPLRAVEVELSGSGGGWTDITHDVLSSLEITRGIRGGGPRHLVAPTGTCRFTLNNSHRNSGTTLGWYSPHHASKRSGWGLNIGFRVRLTDPATGTPRTKFIGKIASILPQPGRYSAMRVAVTAVDWIDEAARWNITADVGPQTNKRGDELLAALVAAMPVAPTATSFDVGADTYAYALDVGRIGATPALSEFARIAISGIDLIFVKADGTLRFEGHHYRLLHTTVDWAITEQMLPADEGSLVLPSSRDDILNTIRVTAHTKLVDGPPTTVVYDQANVIEIAPGETKVLIGPYRDQDTGDTIGAIDVQSPIAGTDYLANDASDGSATDRTSSLTVSVSAGANGVRAEVTNGYSARVYLTRLQLVGRRVLDWATDQREATDSASIAAYGEHAEELDQPYQGNGDVAQAGADFLLLKYKDPLATVREVVVPAFSAAALTKMLTVDISSRISLAETVTGVASEYFINGVTETVPAKGRMTARYILTPAIDPYGGNLFIVDTSAVDGANVLAAF